MGFAVDNAIPLLDHRAPEGLGQVTLPGPWRPEKERVLPLRDEAPGGDLPLRRAVDARIGPARLPAIPIRLRFLECLEAEATKRRLLRFTAGRQTTCPRR